MQATELAWKVAVRNHQHSPGYGLQSSKLTIQPEEHLCFLLPSTIVGTAETWYHNRKKWGRGGASTHIRDEKHCAGASNAGLSEAFWVIHLAFDLSAFSLQIAFQVF